MSMAMLRRGLLETLLHWIPLAALTLLLSGMVYLTVQQNFRGSANDPQVQMATDARNALDGGGAPQSLVPSQQLDIATSLSPYLVIYDANKQVVAASATLHGQSLIPPSGVFDSAKATGRDVLTWMPEVGVRSAIVVMPYGNGYVLAGRSLQVVEEREDALTQQVAAACLATLAITFVVVLATRLVAARLAVARA